MLGGPAAHAPMAVLCREPGFGAGNPDAELVGGPAPDSVKQRRLLAVAFKELENTMGDIGIPGFFTLVPDRLVLIALAFSPVCVGMLSR